MEKISTFDVKAPVVESVLDLFDTMLSMEVETADPENLSDWDSPRIAGSVSFAGEIVGAIKIETTETFSRLMTSEMLGMEVDEIEGEDEVKDVILETCNIIGGNLKSTLNDSGLSCVISSPTITIGKNFGIEILNMARYEKFAFSYQEHSFLVEVCLKLGEDAPSEALKRLTSIDISKFERLDIISSAGDTVIEVFDLMLSMKLEMSESQSGQEMEGVRAVGTINFAGEVRGSLNIQLSETFSRIVTSKMMEIPLEEVTEEEQTNDVIGELCNIVAGNLKSGFCDSGLKCEISPPSITIGDDFTIETLNMARYEQFAFRFYDHDIFVQVCVKIDENAKASTDDAANDVMDSAAIAELLAQANATTDASEDSVDGAQQMAPDVEESPDMGKDVASGGGTAAGTTSLTAGAPALDSQLVSPNLDFILNIPVEISVELGRTRMTIDKVSKLGPGKPVILSNVENEDLGIFANNKLIAKGAITVEHEKYGIRVTEVVSRMERIKSLGE
ncbi:MAG: chemotaxis protein CheX [Deltaproteobacteria bacterium]|nr:chemotaxis protein CheX [Deltaproteobacteria bacterium]